MSTPRVALRSGAAATPRRSTGRGNGSPASQIRPQRLRYDDRAVALLVGLDDRGDGPRERESRAVERVDQLGLGAGFGPVADRHPAGLVVAEVRTRRDLEPPLDAR